MSMFEVLLLAATLFCSLTVGLLFTFAVVVMPGIRKLEDDAFIRAFQVMDGIIQNNHPLFVLVWAGSVLAVVASLILGFPHLDPNGRLLLIFATILYIIGVQLPTMMINVPLNNQLQRVDVAASSPAELTQARETFEGKWNRWNVFRTVVGVSVVVLLLVVQG